MKQVQVKKYFVGFKKQVFSLSPVIGGYIILQLPRQRNYESPSLEKYSAAGENIWMYIHF